MAGGSDHIKVVVRRLPQFMTEEEVLEQINPIPEEVVYHYFVPANPGLTPCAFSSLYVIFSKYCDNLLDFESRFDGYVFVDSKGNSSAALVECAKYEEYSKLDLVKLKEDKKCGSVEASNEYKEFVEKLKTAESVQVPTIEQQLKNLSMGPDAKTLVSQIETPLVKYLLQKSFLKSSRRRNEKEDKKTRPRRKEKDARDKPKGEKERKEPREERRNRRRDRNRKKNETKET